MRNRTVILATLLGFGVLTTACTAATSSSVAAAPSSSSATPTTSPIPTSPAPPADVTGKTSFTIDTYDSFFSPNTLTGSAGQKLELTIDNKGAATHTFTIASEDIDVLLAAGTSQTVEVTFPKSGSTQFVCRFHESMGMVGQLQVQ
jgi:plastocyanin